VILPDRPLGTSNRAKNVAEVAQEVLAGEIASAGGDRKAAIEKFTRAVRLEDALIYEEPPMWYAPVRERLATWRSHWLSLVLRETVSQEVDATARYPA
jgi:hypothetical protein